MTTVTLNLSEQTAQRARHAAEVLQRPLDDLLTEMLEAVLPTVEDAPLDMQAELTRMTWFNNQRCSENRPSSCGRVVVWSRRPANATTRRHDSFSSFVVS